MVYFHIDRVIRYLESLGYKGPRRIFTEPLPVDVNGTRKDNSWYSPWDRLLTFGTGAIDDAEDGETIVHELGHVLGLGVAQVARGGDRDAPTRRSHCL